MAFTLEAPGILSNVVGSAEPGADLAIGQRVELTWEIHEEVSIPLFSVAV